MIGELWTAAKIIGLLLGGLIIFAPASDSGRDSIEYKDSDDPSGPWDDNEGDDRHRCRDGSLDIRFSENREDNDD